MGDIMKKYFIALLMCVLVCDAGFSATSGRTGRRIVKDDGLGVTAPGVRVRRPSIDADLIPWSGGAVVEPDNKTEEDDVKSEGSGDANETVPPLEEETEWEKRRKACLSNNIGIGNTYVWASKDSAGKDYSQMIEDIKNPENNACFARVSFKHTDTKVKTSDLISRYVMMGDTVKCGSWFDKENLEDRVLEAKKSARIWGTVGASVGGAAVGVGISEGAMAIAAHMGSDSKLMGQKALSDAEWLKKKLQNLKKESPNDHEKVCGLLKKLWEGGTNSPCGASAEYKSDVVTQKDREAYCDHSIYNEC
jgi:hypothetical protein